ncbi:motility associated factor glycosyltransferase family protein [Clostridium tyrobutyricum]|uniref:motility associated factor glycosyltransferase family protein n=1 Tax=Clostridium tyrobutyricum TaxID=1519 RepID=UPI001C3D75FA|nr:6-hydroxymethylpterin diphosphokinase MptE-like protein [Clostridium tyrobutyricum]MBV4437205.1 DUF115 domain-containing protein [Clostridium tyrobutyricum]
MDNKIFVENLCILKKLGKQQLISDKYFDIEKSLDRNYTFRYDISDKKIYINSKYNVNNEMNTLFKNIDFSKNNLFVVYGIGLGYHVKKLIDMSSEDSVIFLIEKDMKILNTYLRCKNFTELRSKKIVIFFGDEQEIFSQISNYIFNFKVMPIILNYTPVILSSYYTIYGNWIDHMNKKIMKLIRHAFFNLGNDVKDTIIGLQNNFLNMKELIENPSIEIVKNSYINKPAIIVGAGPSLDKNIKDLKAAQGKALIFATDAVISTLEKNDIIPDAVFSIERGIETYNKFYKNNELNSKTIFVGPPVVRNEVLTKIKNNKKLLCLKKDELINEWINNDILNENRLIKMGSSCAHVAFAFAKYLNADPIILVGMDLCYSDNGVTHSKDVEVKNVIDVDNKDNIYVKDIHGKMLPTSNAFKNFLTFIEVEIARDLGDRKYIDATEGGAFKEGTKIMNLKSVISEYCTQKIDSLYDSVPNKRNLDYNKYNKAIEELENLENKFNNLKIDSENYLKKISKLENEDFNIDDMKNTLKRISSIDYIICNDGVVRTFLQGIYINGKIEENYISNDINESNMIEKLKVRKEYMNLINISCNAVINSIENILKDMSYEFK